MAEGPRNKYRYLSVAVRKFFFGGGEWDQELEACHIEG